ETIEVVQGPAAELFGRGGAGGVVNVVTRSPLSGSPSEATLEVGSFNHRRATAQIAGRVNRTVGLRISGMAEDSGGFRDGYFLHRYGVNPSAGFVLGDATTLTVSYEHLFDRRLADRGIPSQAGRPVAAPASQFFGSTTQNVPRSAVDSVSASFEHRLGRSVFFRNNTLVGRYDKFYQNVYAGSAVNAAGLFHVSGY